MFVVVWSFCSFIIPTLSFFPVSNRLTGTIHLMTSFYDWRKPLLRTTLLHRWHLSLKISQGLLFFVWWQAGHRSCLKFQTNLFSTWWLLNWWQSGNGRRWKRFDFHFWIIWSKQPDFLVRLSFKLVFRCEYFIYCLWCTYLVYYYPFVYIYLSNWNENRQINIMRN